MPDFLDLTSIGATELLAILDQAEARKTARSEGVPRGQPDRDAPLDGRVLALIFTSPSTRSRLGFDLAMRQMGGHSVMLGSVDSHMGRGESMADTARMISFLADVAAVRTSAHAGLVEFAEASSIPVVNAMTDQGHPTQIMACLMTLRERGIDLSEAHLAWIGDGNNVCASFIHAACAFGYRLTVGAPSAYAPDEAVVAAARARGGRIEVFDDAIAAASGADVVITDTFFSIGQERSDERLRTFMPFQVNEELMARAAPGALFSHCLPAYRGQEVTSGVIDGPCSTVLDEAENKVYLVKAVLGWCLGEGPE